MAFARALYERFRQLIAEFAKFGVIGVIGLFITNGVYDVLYNHMHVGPVKSTTIATIIAAVCTYLGNRYWSFRHRERTGILREAVIFFVLNGIGLLIQDAAVAFNYYVLGLGDNKAAGFVALNLGIAVATLFRFWSYRQFVWIAPPAAEGGGDTGHVRPPAGPPATVRSDAAGAPARHAARGGTVRHSPVTRVNGHRDGTHRAGGRTLQDGTKTQAPSPYQG